MNTLLHRERRTNGMSRIEERAQHSIPWLEAQAIVIGGVCFVVRWSWWLHRSIILCTSSKQRRNKMQSCTGQEHHQRCQGGVNSSAKNWLYVVLSSYVVVKSASWLLCGGTCDLCCGYCSWNDEKWPYSNQISFQNVIWWSLVKQSCPYSNYGCKVIVCQQLAATCW